MPSFLGLGVEWLVSNFYKPTYTYLKASPVRNDKKDEERNPNLHPFMSFISYT